jgi:hypothetical protein
MCGTRQTGRPDSSRPLSNTIELKQFKIKKTPSLRSGDRAFIVRYNGPCTAQLVAAAPSGKEGMPMDTFQTIMVMLAFGSFLLALLTHIDKRK